MQDFRTFSSERTPFLEVTRLCDIGSWTDHFCFIRGSDNSHNILDLASNFHHLESLNLLMSNNELVAEVPQFPKLVLYFYLYE